MNDGSRAPFVLVPDAQVARALAIVRQAEPRAIATAIPLADRLDSALGGSRTAAWLVSNLGLLALLLAATGIYGVVAYTAEQRRKEIGIRMALGASPREVASLIWLLNARAAAIGLLAGLAIAMAGSRALESQLYGVSRFDPPAYAAALAVLLLAGFAASVVPVRRAARTDALAALHND